MGEATFSQLASDGMMRAMACIQHSTRQKRMSAGARPTWWFAFGGWQAVGDAGSDSQGVAGHLWVCPSASTQVMTSRPLSLLLLPESIATAA